MGKQNDDVVEEKEKLTYLCLSIEELNLSTRGLFFLMQFSLEQAVIRAAKVEQKRENKQPITGEDECDYIFGNSAIALLTLLRKK